MMTKKKLKHIIIAGFIGISTGIIVGGCGSSTPIEGTVVRKLEVMDNENMPQYSVWVKYSDKDEESVKSYYVYQQYYEEVHPGDTFDKAYSLSDGKTEYSILP